MLEGEYLELCEDLKNKYEEKEKELEKMKEEKKELMKVIYGVYGFLRINMENEIMGLNESGDLIDQLNLLRTYLSTFFDENFLT